MNTQTKLTIGSLVLAVLLIGAAVMFSGGSGSSFGTPEVSAEGVAVVENGTQYVDITARAGYSPRLTKAQAGRDTVIRMKTKDTFDCSMALVIPAVDYQSYLEPSGVAEITIPADKAQGTIEGMCSMGMYHFAINFE